MIIVNCFQNSSSVIENDCKPLLNVILRDGNKLVTNEQLEPKDETDVKEKMASLKDREEKVETVVEIVKLK